MVYNYSNGIGYALHADKEKPHAGSVTTAVHSNYYELLELTPPVVVPHCPPFCRLPAGWRAGCN